jgi:hypothetical protein
VPGDYEVGFGKPPREHQFKKGQIANPHGAAGKRGAARKRANRSTIVSTIKQELTRKRRVEVNGVVQNLDTLALVIRRLVNDAVTGNAAAQREVRRWLTEFPELVEERPPVTQVEVRFIAPSNPFLHPSSDLLSKFHEAHPKAPPQDIALLLTYLESNPDLS